MEIDGVGIPAAEDNSRCLFCGKSPALRYKVYSCRLSPPWDRSDRTKLFNDHLDDKVAWNPATGRATSWLGTGWQQLAPLVAAEFHKANGVRQLWH